MASKRYLKNGQIVMDTVVILIIVFAVSLVGGRIFSPTLKNTFTTVSDKIDARAVQLVEKASNPKQAARLQNTTAPNISDGLDSPDYAQLALNPQPGILRSASSPALQPSIQIASSLAAPNTQPNNVVYSPTGELATAANYEVNNSSTLANFTQPDSKETPIKPNPVFPPGIPTSQSNNTDPLLYLGLGNDFDPVTGRSPYGLGDPYGGVTQPYDKEFFGNLFDTPQYQKAVISRDFPTPQVNINYVSKEVTDFLAKNTKFGLIPRLTELNKGLVGTDSTPQYWMLDAPGTVPEGQTRRSINAGLMADLYRKYPKEYADSIIQRDLSYDNNLDFGKKTDNSYTGISSSATGTSSSTTSTYSNTASTSSAIPQSGPYSAEYWASQPAAVQALQNISDPTERTAKATELAHQGYTIDVPIMVWGWDPQITMELRGQYGYTWVPSALQPNITIAPGLTVPGMQSYDPNHPPADSIAVPQQFQTGISSTPASATIAAGAATVSSTTGMSRGSVIQSSATDTTSRSTTEASRSSNGRSR